MEGLCIQTKFGCHTGCAFRAQEDGEELVEAFVQDSPSALSTSSEGIGSQASARRQAGVAEVLLQREQQLKSTDEDFGMGGGSDAT